MSETQNNYPYEFGGQKIRCVGDQIIVRKMGVMVHPINKDIKDFEKRNEQDQWAIALDHPFKGLVVMVGDGRVSGTEMQPPTVNIGDVVFTKRPLSERIRLDVGAGIEQLYVIREYDCQIVVSKPEIQAEKDDKVEPSQN